MTKPSIHHARAKHIKIDFHFVREKMMVGVLNVQYTPVKEQIAAVLTKAFHTIEDTTDSDQEAIETWGRLKCF